MKKRRNIFVGLLILAVICTAACGKSKSSFTKDDLLGKWSSENAVVFLEFNEDGTGSLYTGDGSAKLPFSYSLEGTAVNVTSKGITGGEKTSVYQAKKDGDTWILEQEIQGQTRIYTKE